MTQNKFFIISLGKNCSKYVDICVDSIKSQTYKNFSFVFIDDHSEDDTLQRLKLRNAPSAKLTGHSGPMWAMKAAVTMAPEDSIIVQCDSDDALKSNALEYLNEIYNDDVWLTYGNYITDKGQQPFMDTSIPLNIHQTCAYRNYPFMYMHLRSFRKKLYMQLPEETFFDIPVYPDAHVFLSMMEMAGPDHMCNINEPLYIYNTSNPESIIKKFSAEERHEAYGYIGSLKKQSRLESL